MHVRAMSFLTRSDSQGIILLMFISNICMVVSKVDIRFIVNFEEGVLIFHVRGSSITSSEPFL